MRNPLAPSWLEPRDNAHLDSKVWPHSAKRNESGELEIGGVSVGELVSKYGTPLYVIDEEEFRSRLKAVKRAFTEAAREIGTEAKIYYAAKALLTTEIARWVDEAGLAIDVATGGELSFALHGGTDPARIGMHGNNKSLFEIGRAISSGVGNLVIDSDSEIERIASIAGAQGVVQAVRIRVNSGVHASTHDYLATSREDQKFGIAIDDVPDLVAKIRSHSSLKFLGLHSHIGSQIFSVDGFMAAAERLVELHAELLSGGEVPELNLGGGFGIAYTSNENPMEIAEIATRITRGVQRQCLRLGIPIPKLAFEPGRIIAGPAGITLYNVGTIKDVKVTDGEASGIRKYVAVDGGMSDNLRTALYGANYTATLASRISVAMPSLARVVGKHCESGDVVVDADYLPSDLAINELLAVATTGAYCHSLASNYNYLTKPPLASVRNGESRLLMRGETEQDLLARDSYYQPGGNVEN